MAANPMTHLHLFPEDFPSTTITIVVNGLRGVDDGKTLRDRVEAAWWVLGYGIGLMPDTHPVAARIYTDAEVANLLEATSTHEGMKALPWAAILGVLIALVKKWLNI